MTTHVTPYPPLDLGRALRRVNSRLDLVMTMHDRNGARDCRAVADFLSRETDHREAQALAARARAVTRFLEGHRHV